MIDFVKGMMLI